MGGLGWKSRGKVTFVLGIMFALSCPITKAARILAVPVDGSHWINMKILIEELNLRGHSITVLCYSINWYIKESPDLYQTVTVQAQGNTDEFPMKEVMEKLVRMSLDRLQNSNRVWGEIMFLNLMVKTIYNYHRLYQHFNMAIFENKTLLNQFEDANFDLILTDPIFGTGPMLAYYLKVPMVYFLRSHMMGDAHVLTAPSPPSYIPLPGSQLTDKMDFLQRTGNVINSVIQHFLLEFLIYPLYNDICRRYLGPDTDIKSILLRADVWLMIVDFVFEFPRPTMPNIVYTGGFQCKPARPLTAEFEEFVQSSGKHGIVVMSLGSIVHSLPMEITMKIAEAFAQIPQKVIWRYDGETPPNIANNTLLAKWIPQNDLLGHPNTRAFVSHGGTNGMYEAIYHGVPVVGMPLLFDQFDNVVRLASRGAAKGINIATMHSTDLLQALNEVINGTSYGDNMKRLSALHRDQPESPIERAVFWVEYVARHKGAGHLHPESHRLPWYAYYCVDVMIFLLTVLLLLTVLVVGTLKKLCRVVCGKKQKTE